MKKIFLRFLVPFVLVCGLAFACSGCSFDQRQGGTTYQGETEKQQSSKSQKGSKAYQECMEMLKQFDELMSDYMKISEQYEANPERYFDEYEKVASEYLEFFEQLQTVMDSTSDEMSWSESMKVTLEYSRILSKYAG